MNIKKLLVLGVLSAGTILAGSLAIGQQKAQAHCTLYHPHHCPVPTPPPTIRPDPVRWSEVRVKICNSTGSAIFYNIHNSSQRLPNRKCRTHTRKVTPGTTALRMRWDNGKNRDVSRLVLHRKTYRFRWRSNGTLSLYRD